MDMGYISIAYVARSYTKPSPRFFHGFYLSFAGLLICLLTGVSQYYSPIFHMTPTRLRQHIRHLLVWLGGEGLWDLGKEILLYRSIAIGNRTCL